MKKIEMIKSHDEFSDMIHNSKFKKNYNLIMYYRPTKYQFTHYGIAVSKKLGNAVTRNLCKRRMRMIIDKYKNQLNPSYDYIIMMRENSSKITYEQLEKSFEKLLDI